MLIDCYTTRGYRPDMTTEESSNQVRLVCMDLEGTLCHGRHLWAGVVGNRFPSASRAPWVAGHVLYIIWAALAQRRLGTASASTLTRKGVHGLASLLAGMEQEAANALFERTGRIMAAEARSALLAALRSHQSAGHHAVVVSAAFEPVTREVARALDVADALGTSLEVVDGRYTGRLAAQPLQGRNKLTALQRFFEERSATVDWPESYAYADSITDTPLLEAVGHPIAVNPDSQLARLARSRGWPILDTRRGRPNPDALQGTAR